MVLLLLYPDAPPFLNFLYDKDDWSCHLMQFAFYSDKPKYYADMKCYNIAEKDYIIHTFWKRRALPVINFHRQDLASYGISIQVLSTLIG